MTDIKPGSRWLLPVTMLKGLTRGGYARFATDLGFQMAILPKELYILIPADRITELEAEVARLREEILRARD